MQAHLQDTILNCCTANVDFRLPSVDEVCREADVSRATFYKYFDSVQTAVDLLGQLLLDEMVDDTATIFEGTSPLERITTGVQLFLMRSATDPAWAAFVARVVQLSPDTVFARSVATDIDDASRAGEISIPNPDSAISLALGATFEAIRHVHETGDRRRDYVESLTVMILRALGVVEDRARALVRERSIHIRGLAPDYLDWWRDPWI